MLSERCGLDGARHTVLCVFGLVSILEKPDELLYLFLEMSLLLVREDLRVVRMKSTFFIRFRRKHGGWHSEKLLPVFSVSHRCVDRNKTIILTTKLLLIFKCPSPPSAGVGIILPSLPERRVSAAHTDIPSTTLLIDLELHSQTIKEALLLYLALGRERRKNAGELGVLFGEALIYC